MSTRGALMHSIMFDDGFIFDAVNGWRRDPVCPFCFKPKRTIEVK